MRNYCGVTTTGWNGLKIGEKKLRNVSQCDGFTFLRLRWLATTHEAPLLQNWLSFASYTDVLGVRSR
jgi:hypothetical protein